MAMSMGPFGAGTGNKTNEIKYVEGSKYASKPAVYLANAFKSPSLSLSLSLSLSAMASNAGC